MKKLLSLVLSLAAFLCCLTACDTFDSIFGKKSGVNKEYYENCAVFTFDNFESRICIELARTDLGDGAIYYQINLEEGALSISYKDTGLIHEKQPLGEFTADDNMPINGSGGYIEGDKIAITFEAFSPVSGEIIIAFTEDALKAVHKDKELHEHTFTYTSAGKIGHYSSATCGCPSEEGTTPHYDGDTDYICDFCKCDMTEFAEEWLYDETHHWYVSDDYAVYCYGEHEDDLDNDLLCDVCGYDMNEDYPPLVDVTISLRNHTGCSWLNELSAEDIAEIKIISEAVGVAPGNLKNISSSTDEAVIARIFEEYYWLDTAPISKMDGQIDGGSGVTVKFILKDGTAKELYINNGNYRDTNDDYFELLYTPKFKDTDNAVMAYGFITYIGTGTVYDKDNNPVCEIPIDELEFVESDGCVDAVVTGYYYTVATEFGTLWFDYSNDLFYLRYSEGNNDYREYYRIVGKNLDELIVKYSISSESHSISYQSDRTAEFLIEGFAPTSAKPGDSVVLRTNPIMDADLTFYANGVKLTQTHADSDYWEYVFIMPDEDVVITHEITDGFLPD